MVGKDNVVGQGCLVPSETRVEASIVIENVTKTFAATGREVRALGPVSLHVQPREFLTIVGPSGCGKSTLINLVAGLFPVTSGTIRIDGAPVAGVPKDIGYVFQQYTRTLLPWRTVYRNAELGLEIRGVPFHARRAPVLRALEMMGLVETAEQRPYELSGGMQQRLVIARTLAYNPRVLLMDEPFGALDAQTRELLQDDLLRIAAAERKTTIFITHDIREALYLGDRVVVMSARPGRILEIVQPGFPQPRRPEVKLDLEFTRLAAAIWGLLRPEVAGRARGGSP